MRRGSLPRPPALVRGLLEAVLAEAGWPWCRAVSLLLDELVVREEEM